MFINIDYLIILDVILVNDMQIISFFLICNGALIRGGDCLILWPRGWALIRAWALIRGNMVIKDVHYTITDL